MLEQVRQRLKYEEYGVALVFTLLVTAVLLILATGIVSVVFTDSEIASAREEQKSARYVSESAVEIIKQEVKADLDADESPLRLNVERPLKLDSKLLTYKYSVESDGTNRFSIIVTYPVGRSSTLTATVQYTPEFIPTPSPTETPDTPPPTIPPEQDVTPAPDDQTTVLDYALVNGGVLRLTLVPLMVNGQIFSNSSVQMVPGLGISGPVKAYGPIFGGEQNLPPELILPNQRRLPMPVIDWQYIKEHANANNKVDYGTLTPYLNGARLAEGDIVFVEGNLNVTRGTTANALICATGSIIFYGDFKFPIKKDGVLGVIAGKNVNLISLSENQDLEGVQGPQLRGLVIAGNNINTQGDASVKGGLIAGNDFGYGTGELDINYEDIIDEQKVYPAKQVIERFGKNIIKNYETLKRDAPSPEGTGGSDSDSGVGTTPSQDIIDPRNSIPSSIKIIRWEED